MSLLREHMHILINGHSHAMHPLFVPTQEPCHVSSAAVVINLVAGNNKQCSCSGVTQACVVGKICCRIAATMFHKLPAHAPSSCGAGNGVAAAASGVAPAVSTAAAAGLESEDEEISDLDE